MALCGVCFGEMTIATTYAHERCWTALSRAGRDNLQINYNSIIRQHVEERNDTMRRETASTSEGTKVPTVSDDEAMAKFKLSKDDYSKLPLLCQMALKEAACLSAVGVGATNLWMVFSTDYDGNQQSDVLCAPSGIDAIRRYASYHEYDGDTEFDEKPTAYHLPAAAPYGVMRYGDMEQAHWNDVF